MPPDAWLADAHFPVTRSTAGDLLRRALACGALDLPLPGSGRTFDRWLALAEISAVDLVLGRLAEAHADAVAILAELGGSEPQGLWGVWAAESAGPPLDAKRDGEEWVLNGSKGWCSGATFLDFALVTAHADDGRRLFAVEVPHVVPQPATWRAVGMAASDSVAVTMTGVRGVTVGDPGAYLERPGFWHGGAGVAACWYGGALGAARTLLGAARERPRDPHTLAHVGAVDAIVCGLRAHLAVAAQEIDADPTGPGAQRRAVQVRARVEAGAAEVLDRVGRALGAAPLCLDSVHAQRAADLPVFLRQSHAERDLAGLGELAVEEASW